MSAPSMTPIRFGFLQNDLDARGFKILNLDQSNLATGSFGPQDASTVFAGPASGLSAVPEFRLLTASEVGAQPADATLTSFAALTPTFLGLSFSELDPPISSSYLRVSPLGVISFDSASTFLATINAQEKLPPNAAGENFLLSSTIAGVYSWIAPGAGDPGSGTVTSVDVAGLNGIGVAGNPITAGGTITLSLGNITPTTVNGITLSTVGGGDITLEGSVNLNNFTVVGAGFFGSNVSVINSLSVTGDFPLALTLTGLTSLTLPTSGVVATVAGTEPAMGNPSANGQVFSSLIDGTRSWITPAPSIFSDNAALVQNSVDTTKKLRFDLGSLTSGQTRVLTPPNYDGIIATLTGPENLQNKTLVTPVLGVATATSINKVAITAPSIASTLAILNGVTFTVNNSITLLTDGTAGTKQLNIGAGGTLGSAAFVADSALVHTTGAETIAGVKTFSSAPIVSAATASTFAKFDASKNLVSSVAGADYIAVTGTPVIGQAPVATSSTTATWQNIAGAGAPFIDSTAIIRGSVDATKLLKIEVDGFTTATTRTLTAPNFDGTISTLAGTETLSGKTLVTPVLGVAAGTSLEITGPAGTGFIGFEEQSGAPATPSEGLRLYADATGRLSWRRQSDTFTRTFDATLTDNRVYTLQDVTGTLALTSNHLGVFGSTTSTQLRGVISDETGTGALVFANAPTLIAPVLGLATATRFNNVVITAPASPASLTILADKALTVNDLIILASDGTGTRTLNIGGGGTLPALSAAYRAETYFEPALGNPGTNGHVLASQIDGTRSWVAPGGGGGSGTVTDFSAGNLVVGASTLFTTTEATTTTTPALSFALTDQAANTFFGNNSGSAAAPIFMTAANARTSLGLVLGTNVQAWDADLDTWAAITPGTGVGTFLATPSSANLRAALTDETGSGAAVFADTPTLIAPVLGAATATSLTLTTDLAVADGGTGASTLTNHGVLLGQGTSAVAATAAGTAGQVLTSGGASADPTYQSATGYTLTCLSTSAGLNYADSSTYYVGSAPTNLAGSSTWARHRMHIPKTGTIKVISVHVDTGAGATSTESVSHYLRIDDGGTADVTLSTSEVWPTSGNSTDYNYTGLSIAVTAGQYVAFKIVTPAWVTNPTGVTVRATIYIE